MITFKVETKSGFVPYRVWYVETKNSMFWCNPDWYIVTKVEAKEKNNGH